MTDICGSGNYHDWLYLVDSDIHDWLKPFMTHLNMNCPCSFCSSRSFICLDPYFQNIELLEEVGTKDESKTTALYLQVQCTTCSNIILFKTGGDIFEKYVDSLHSKEKSLFESNTEEEFTKKLNHIVSEVK